MVRITRKENVSGTTTMALEGRIVSEWIEVVETECQSLLSQGRHVLLDLSGVTFVEAEGVHMIQRLLRNGCGVVNGPLFIQQLLCT